MKKLIVLFTTLSIITSYPPTVKAQLIDNGDGTISDCDLGIMWLKDAKAPGSTSLTYTEAVAYVASLNATRYLGYNDWRLPSGTHPSGTTCESYDGQYYYRCTNTEFTHLFFDELGGCSGWDIDHMCDAWGFGIPNTNTARYLFDNIPTVAVGASGPAFIYWTSMQDDPDHAWTFSFQNASYKNINSSATSTYRLNAWVVRDFSGVCEIKKGSVILHDLSGSMTWGHDGNWNVPLEEQRISMAKSAAKFFLDLLYLHGENAVDFGITEFPPHPWSSAVGCNGNVITDLAMLNTSVYDAAINTIDNDLQTGGNTPLLAGLEVAANMFPSDIQNRSILLLSDGYHNCPHTVSIGDAGLQAIINNLVANNIKVSAVAFAREEDIDESILTEISTATSGEYHGVTGPGFDLTNWDPALDLKDTYKNILIDHLGIEGILDPVKVLERGESFSFPVRICDADTLITFFVTWRYPEDRIKLNLYSSDGEQVPVSSIRMLNSDKHTIKSVSKSFLNQPGKLSAEPWRVELLADSTSKNKAVTCLYGALTSSALNLKFSTNKRSYLTGEQIKLTASVTEHGTVLTDLNEIYVRVSVPKEGKGNWFAANIDSFPQIIDTQGKNLQDQLAPMQKAARYIKDVLDKKFPDRTEVLKITLKDDGSGGDEQANDGTYTAIFPDTKKQGSYIFQLSANGNTKLGIPFTREKQLTNQVNVGVSPDYTLVKVEKQIRDDQTHDFYNIIVTPIDELNNYLGPGYANKIKIQVPQSTYSGRIIDKMNGDYSQQVAINKSQYPGKIKVFIIIDDIVITKSIGYNWSVSLHGGIAIPTGTFANNYDPGYNVLVDADYHFTSNWSIVALFGYNNFKSKVAGIDDTYLVNVSANARYGQQLGGPWSIYLGAGPGVYIPKSGDTKLGANVGFGFNYDYNGSIIFELGGDYHSVFGNDTKFIHNHIGIVYRF